MANFHIFILFLLSSSNHFCVTFFFKLFELNFSINQLSKKKSIATILMGNIKYTYFYYTVYKQCINQSTTNFMEHLFNTKSDLEHCIVTLKSNIIVIIKFMSASLFFSLISFEYNGKNDAKTS